MRITKYWFLLIAAVALALVMAGCEKTGDPVKGNVAPDTRILSYVISTASMPDSAGNPTTNYSVTVYWAGSDIDGGIKKFLYEDNAGIHSGEEVRSQKDFVYDFAQASTSYIMTVRAVDNLDAVDPTPAEITITRDFGTVQTAILDGPPNGAEVSTATRYKVGTSSPSGAVTAINYRVNDGAPQSIAVDANGEATIDVTDMDFGSAVIFFAGIRDDGEVDQTEASASVVVRDGFFPTIINLSSVQDGGGWFSGVQIDFSWDVVMSYYYGIAPDDLYSFAWDDNTNFAKTDSAMASGWTETNAWSAADSLVTPGDHTLYIKARDFAGGIGLLSITVAVAAFNPTDGLFVANDFSWDPGFDYGTPLEVANDGFFNGWTYDGTVSSDPALVPDDIGSYSSVVLYGDGGYNNQNNGELFAAYASAGGNVWIGGYELNDMAHTFAAYGIYPAVFSTSGGNYGGADGVEGTAYEDINLELPSPITNRSYHRVYPDLDNTMSIFSVRGNDGDARSCATRADMPNGNVVIVMGQTIPFMAPDAQTQAYGDYVLGTEFGETK
jgi:hypothetical protein